MCKVLTVIREENANIERIEKFVKAQIADLQGEKSGYSVYRDGKSSFYMGIENYNRDTMYKNIRYSGEKTYICHTRTATGGEMTEKGLHLQKLYEHYVFAHNGTVTKLSDVKDYSDSYHFFKTLTAIAEDKVTYDDIEEMVNEFEFNGKGFLVDEKNEELHVWACGYSFGGIYITIFEDFIALTSYDPELELKEPKLKTVLGFQFKEAEVKEEFEPLYQEKKDDVYLKMEKHILTTRQELKRKYVYTTPKWIGKKGKHHNHNYKK